MPELDPELSLDPDTAFLILLKAREFDAKEAGTDPDREVEPSQTASYLLGTPTISDYLDALSQFGFSLDDLLGEQVGTPQQTRAD